MTGELEDWLEDYALQINKWRKQPVHRCLSNELLLDMEGQAEALLWICFNLFHRYTPNTSSKPLLPMEADLCGRGELVAGAQWGSLGATEEEMDAQLPGAFSF
jgi:hypothetical protein